MEASYIDTHIVVWLHIGDLNKFSPKAINLLENSALYYSSIVILELCYLHEIGRLNYTPAQIIEDLGMLDLKPKDFLLADLIKEASSISWTRDPFDRLIVAQAQLAKHPLISKDEHIRSNYPLTIW